MKTDLYTKIVLSLIAVLLFMNLLTGGLITPANAAKEPTGYVQVPVNSDGSINVKVINEFAPQDVIIAGWKSGYHSEGKAYLSETPHYLPESNAALAPFPVAGK